MYVRVQNKREMKVHVLPIRCIMHTYVDISLTTYGIVRFDSYLMGGAVAHIQGVVLKNPRRDSPSKSTSLGRMDPWHT